uniref:Uncharacterized protein n=1 Tax=Leersia perrieri TaxID=77586 RepID=A0A0D9X870_9ORYZ
MGIRDPILDGGKEEGENDGYLPGDGQIDAGLLARLRLWLDEGGQGSGAAAWVGRFLWVVVDGDGGLGNNGFCSALSPPSRACVDPVVG